MLLEHLMLARPRCAVSCYHLSLIIRIGLLERTLFQHPILVLVDVCAIRLRERSGGHSREGATTSEGLVERE